MPQTLEVYTVQLAKWRAVKAMGVELLDTTVKSGDRAFAPVWSMVMGVKDGSVSEEEYTRLYNAMMSHSQSSNPAAWEKLLAGGKVALACYCKADHFCHRYLLKDIVKDVCAQRGIVYIDQGEIR